MKINNCPWCGSKSMIMRFPHNGGWVECSNFDSCSVSGPISSEINEAVRLWNSVMTEKQWAAKTVRKIHRKLSRAAGESMGGEA